ANSPASRQPDAGLFSGTATESAPLTPKQRILSFFKNHKLLIMLRSLPDMEANLDFSFVTALLGVFSTSLPRGRFGGREAVDWSAARIGSAAWI
ncbi:hypothetical protein ACC674_36775, partial [Rhizobium ruizarguesonis]